MKSIILIDLSGIYWANYHATKDQSVNEAYELTVGKVHQLRHGYDYIACCVDMPPYFRKELLPSYKANREAQPPQAVELFERAKARLYADGILLWGAQGFEADDVAAWACRAADDFSGKCKDMSDMLAVTLATGDKDWMSLVDDEKATRLLSTRTGKFLQKLDVVEKLGVSPDMVVDFLALCGDKGDNVPGVPGVGPVKAAKLLMVYGTLDEVLANADKQTPALRDALIEHAGAARLAKKLVTLRTDVPLDFAELFKERKEQPLTDQAYAGGFEDDDQEPESAEPFVPEISAPIPDLKPAPKPASFAPPKSTPRTEVVEKTNGAIVVHQEQKWNLQLQPRSIDGVYKLAKGLLESRLYSKFSNPEAIMAVILRGREMGLTALTALECFHVIEGRPAPYAHLIIARAQAHPDCEYFSYVGGNDSYAEYVTKHRHNPSPTSLRYTIEQAEAAGRLRPNSKGGPSQWVKMPAEFLRKTCGVQLTRIVYPDAALGLYSVEELEGGND